MTRITGPCPVYRPSSPLGILRPDTSTISIFPITWDATYILIGLSHLTTWLIATASTSIERGRLRLELSVDRFTKPFSTNDQTFIPFMWFSRFATEAQNFQVNTLLYMWHYYNWNVFILLSIRKDLNVKRHLHTMQAKWETCMLIVLQMRYWIDFT